MSKQEDLLVFDEDEAVKYIYSALSPELKKRISKDDIDYVLDIMYDYYDENDLIDEDSLEEASIDAEEMFEYIMACIKKDKVVKLTHDDVMHILEGEFEYGKKMGIYTEVD